MNTGLYQGCKKKQRPAGGTKTAFLEDIMTIQATVISINENVEINWLDENPGDSILLTGEYTARLQDVFGNSYDLPAWGLFVGDNVCLQIN
jgi:hypothetical protein